MLFELDLDLHVLDLRTIVALEKITFNFVDFLGEYWSPGALDWT